MSRPTDIIENEDDNEDMDLKDTKTMLDVLVEALSDIEKKERFKARIEGIVFDEIKHHIQRSQANEKIGIEM